MQIEHFSVLWLIIAIVFAIAEIILPSFGCIFAAGSALVVSGIALFPVVIWQIQVVIFAITSIMSLFFLRPRLLAKMKESQGVISRTDALIGKMGVITSTVDLAVGNGRALIEGHDWAVKSDEHLPIDTKVRVVGSSGIVLNVQKV